MGWFEKGVPSNVRARAAEYRVDDAGGSVFRTYGLVVVGVVATVTVLTMPKHWPNVVSMAPAMLFLALLVGPLILLSRSRTAHGHKIRLMREAGLRGTWVQARILHVQAGIVGRLKGRWSFQRTHLRLGFMDAKTGQPREVSGDLYLHPEEHIVAGHVIWVRCHPTLPEPVFVPVQS